MNYKKYNDYELIYMVRENDDISKNVLFDKYLPVIKNMANNYYTKLKGYNCDYDDFFQEAMIALIQHCILMMKEKIVCSILMLFYA